MKALKQFVMYELYAINLNIDRVRTEQSDQTKQLENNSKNMMKEITPINTVINTVIIGKFQSNYKLFFLTDKKILLQTIKRMEIVTQ